MKTCSMSVLPIYIIILVNYVSSLPTYFMDEMCGQTIDMRSKQIESGRLLLRRPEANGLRNQNCALIIKSPNGKQLVFKFLGIQIETPFGCDRDYIEFFEGYTNNSRSLIGKHCDSLPPMTDFTTAGNQALIAFSRYVQFYHDQFDLTFTAYHRGACSGNEFGCSNGRCIHQDLHCNDFDNCGDGSDYCLLSTGGVVGIVLAAVIILLLIAVVVAFLWYRRRKHNNSQEPVDFYSSFRHKDSPKGIDSFSRTASTKSHQPTRSVHRTDSHNVRLLDPAALTNEYNDISQFGMPPNRVVVGDQPTLLPNEHPSGHYNYAAYYSLPKDDTNGKNMIQIDNYPRRPDLTHQHNEFRIEDNPYLGRSDLNGQYPYTQSLNRRGDPYRIPYSHPATTANRQGMMYDYATNTFQRADPYIISFRSYPSPVPKGDYALYHPDHGFPYHTSTHHDNVDGMKKARSTNTIEDTGIYEPRHAYVSGASFKSEKDKVPKKSALKKSTSDNTLYIRDLEQDEIYYPPDNHRAYIR